MNKTKQPSKKLLIIIFMLLLTINSLAIAQIDKISYLVGTITTYTAKNNISIYDIARKYRVASDHIAMANKMNTEYIKSGKTVMIPTFWIAPLNNFKEGIVLNLPERSLYLYKEGRIISVYPVAIGNAYGWHTPTGDYKIITKTKDPIWFPPAWAKIDHPVMPGPGNPLGDRWMGINGGYGIHATNAPSSVGSAVSHGCIRMYPESARDLYDNVTIGMPVKIIYKTVKLGYSDEDKKIYISIFPDVYSYGTNNISDIKKMLASAALDKIVDEKRLMQIVKEKRGIPETLIGSDYILKIGNQKIGTAFSPIIKDNQVLVSCDLFSALGFNVYYDNITEDINISRKDDILITKLNNYYGYFNGEKIDYKVQPQMLGDLIIVPINILNAFGFIVEQNSNEITLTDIKNPLQNHVAKQTDIINEIAKDSENKFLFKKKY